MKRQSVLNGLIGILTSYGVSHEDAVITAEILIQGTARGFLQHGVERIFQIISGFENKTIDPTAHCKITNEHTGTSTLNANYGLGQVAGKRAMELAVQKAKVTGIGCVGVINASHLGILSYYSEIACEQECLGIVMTTSSPAVVLTGGKKKFLGTNPISYSFPGPHHPFTADFSTSEVSRGTIYQYKENNKEIPLGWGVDENGNDTTDPEKVLLGGLKTIGGSFKGDLVSLMVSVLAGNLIGGVSNQEVVGTKYMNHKPNKGDLFLAFDINKFTPLNSFKDSIEGLITGIKNEETTFRIPGERVHSNNQTQSSEIPVSKKLSKLIEEHLN